jgi:hypothetical protein
MPVRARKLNPGTLKRELVLVYAAPLYHVSVARTWNRYGCTTTLGEAGQGAGSTHIMIMVSGGPRLHRVRVGDVVMMYSLLTGVR